MKYLQTILCCLIAFVFTASAAEKPGFLGLSIGMSRENVNASFQRIVNETGASFRFTAHVPAGSSVTSPIDMYDVQDYIDNVNMMYDGGQVGMMHVITMSMNIGQEPLGHNTKVCNQLRAGKIRQVKPNQYFIVQRENGNAIMLLGFSGNELTEIVVSPLLFNWTTSRPEAIVNMLEKHWNIKFGITEEYMMKTWNCIYKGESLITVHPSRVVYIGKLVSENNEVPVMKLGANQTQFYTCLCNANPWQKNAIPTANGGGMGTIPQMPASVPNTRVMPQPAAPTPAPAPNYGYNQPQARSNTSTTRTCIHCKGSGYSGEYITASQFGHGTIYQWCDICLKMVRSHTHKRCPLCNGLGYK